ncbi:MAG: IS3 family transposase [Acidobacteriia bacterium]|nr:IS3 family transposase [Terriglobia bacterium]
MTRLCAAVRVSRATYYRGLDAPPAEADTMVLRDQIQKIALQWPAYGYRRITGELVRQGYPVNHKRVLRLMRRDNLLCLRRKHSFLRTTDSTHGLPVFPNLAARLRVTRIDQLWVADITYIRLRWEFVYLAVVLDAYSRRVVGWALDVTLEAELALTALRIALAERRPPPGLVHHSDRGVQYACTDYKALLAEHGIRGSMSRKGNPYDNAFAESFIKTLKYEEVYCNEYADLAEAQAAIGEFIDKIYNRQRLHSALGYRPPSEFEQAQMQRRAAGKGRA